MSKKFSRVEALFSSPAEIESIHVLGELTFKKGVQFLGGSNIAIGVAANGEQKYTLEFAALEAQAASDTAGFDVVLVKDIFSFSFEGSALILGELRGVGNCGGHVLLVSHSGDPIQMAPALATDLVRLFRDQEFSGPI